MTRFTFGLSPAQIAAVTAVFFVTAIGALLLAIAFRRWNKRNAG
jgi:hypothetical protein